VVTRLRVFDGDLAADDGLHTATTRALEKLHRAKQICRVRDRQRRHQIVCRLANSFVNTNNRIRDRKFGV
jgi:uncharacterized protein YdiU (UPF0061 family)